VSGGRRLGRCLVTGGSGTFGCAFREHVLAHDLVDELVVFSRDECKQAEQRERCGDARVRWFLGDVRDRERLRRAFRGCDVVVHAAALKRIDACGYNPAEAVATNVAGTRHAIEAALDTGVGRFLLLSTDKACEPVNLYGATKAVAEHLVCLANAYSGRANSVRANGRRADGRRATRFGATRYGNVFGSRGSVLEVWRARAARGLVLHLTAEDATRFWLTPAGAVRAVLVALARLRDAAACPSGEVYVPDLRSVRMRDVAVAVLAEVGGGADPPEVVGLRAGEKLHESLVGRDEARRAYRRPDGHRVLTDDPEDGDVATGACRSDDPTALFSPSETRAALAGLVL